MWKNHTNNHLIKNILSCLQAMNDLQKYFFNLYIERCYGEKHYVCEKYIHEQHQLIGRTFTQLKKSMSKETAWQTWIQPLEYCYEMITTLGFLRYRVTDMSLLEMCAQDFQTIALSIDQAFEIVQIRLRRPQTVKQISSLTVAITSFESVYQNALQVIAQDPVIFLIFIENLMALDNVLNELTRCAGRRL